eukprot:3964153-Amphidinium_carterae.1
MQNKERTIHNKNHKFPRLTKVQYYLHSRRLKSTTLHIYHTETGANKVSLKSTMPTSEATTTTITLQHLQCVSQSPDFAMLQESTQKQSKP